jgi:hypothetical protein
MLQGRCRVLLASLVSPFTAMFRRSAVAFGGILMLLRGGVVRFNYVVFFIHGKLLVEIRIIRSRSLPKHAAGLRHQ